MSKRLSNWISEELSNKGWSGRELARRANISHTTVLDVVKGKRRPTWDFCASIAPVLGKNPAEVFALADLMRVYDEDNTLKEITQTSKQLTIEERQDALKYLYYLLSRR